MRPSVLSTTTTTVISALGVSALGVSALGLALGAAPPASAATLDAAREQAPKTPPLRATTYPLAAVAPASYTVTAGDTVSGIADRFGLRTRDVLAWNGLDWSSVIHPGQVLTLAAPAPATPAADAPAPPAAPASGGTTHTVVGGDTLWAIARAGGVSLAALLSANGLTDASIIYPGQQLVIPSAAPVIEVAASTTPLADAPVVLDAEQVANARIIVEVGRSRGVSDRGIAIALATAMVESWMRNLDWGDRDSLGLFQQRPSAGWGTADQVRDPYRAAAVFFGGAQDPNGVATRGLLDISGWESMDFGAAAQAVQVSAYPDRYGPWEQQAYSWLAGLG